MPLKFPNGYKSLSFTEIWSDKMSEISFSEALWVVEKVKIKDDWI